MLKWPKLQLASSDEVHVTFRFFTRGTTSWCDTGHEVAWTQSIVPRTAFAAQPRAKVAASRSAEVQIEATGDDWLARAGRTEFTVRSAAGVIEHLCVDGHEILTRGPQLNVWRAPTDNDGLKLFAVVNWGGAKMLTDSLKAGYDRMELVDTKCELRTARGGAPRFEIRQRWLCPGAKRFIIHRHNYEFRPDGSLSIANSFDADKRLPELPRIGVSLVVPAGFEQLEWFGNGPLENYSDRKRGAIVARHRSTVMAQYVPYIVPQEHGNHTDVRWLALQAAGGRGVRFTADQLMNASASHFTANDLFVAKHTTDLTPRPEVHVHLDHGQRGLGTASCGPDTLPRYRIPAGKYALDFTMTALG